MNVGRALAVARVAKIFSSIQAFTELWSRRLSALPVCPFLKILLALKRKLFGLTTLHVGPQFPRQGLNRCPLHWKCGVLTTGLPGTSLPASFLDFPHGETEAQSGSLATADTPLLYLPYTPLGPEPPQGMGEGLHFREMRWTPSLPTPSRRPLLVPGMLGLLAELPKHLL